MESQFPQTRLLKIPQFPLILSFLFHSLIANANFKWLWLGIVPFSMNYLSTIMFVLNRIDLKNRAVEERNILESHQKWVRGP